jgi:hypothetical protein
MSLRARVIRPIVPPAVTLRYTAGAGAGGASLPVARRQQEETNWCWAAGAQMVLRFKGQAAVTQCEIVNRALGRTDCCVNGSGVDCNQPMTVDAGGGPEMDITKIYLSYGIGAAYDDAQVPFTTLETEISVARPVQVFYAWTGTGGHVAIVYGWEIAPDGSEFAMVHDPWYASYSRARFSALQDAYGFGTWAGTFTRIA